jgi:hypothetical protein
MSRITQFRGREIALMKRISLFLLAAAFALALAGSASAANRTDYHGSLVENPLTADATGGPLRGARLETLWIFSADFEDLTGDNAGWTSYDLSGTVAQDNYWHHDTIRLTEDYLGESTWWCGTYNICWRQPRGYGNEWRQMLQRTLTAGEMGTEGDLVELEWDQRYAMERLYDYGYVEVMGPSDTEWVTVATFNNGGFQGAGTPVNWTHPQHGHPTVDLSSYAGEEVDLRYRFESDEAYSAQDQYDNAQHSVRDGAWQLDNITLSVNGSPTFYDDSESGNMGWIHEPLEPAGQTGVQFFRGQYGIHFETGRPFTCEDRPYGSWMYAAVDPFTSTTVDDEDTWLMSPPIDISGAQKLVGLWDMWFDLPQFAHQGADLYLAAGDIYECVTDMGGFIDEDPGWWYGGPFWSVWRDNWDAFTGNDWLAIVWTIFTLSPPEEPHMGGIFFHRQKVGIPSGDAGTAFERDTWNDFNDRFQEQIADALLDTARILVQDDDDIATVYLMATADGGATWESYQCNRESPESDWWDTPPPVNQIAAGNRINYYWEATDGVGNTAVYPSGAPNSTREFSILPMEATVSNPGILLVDKHGRNTPGELRYGDVRHTSEYYYAEALEILGYEWEVYDVEVPSGTNEQSHGPDTMGYKYYDTQIWWTNNFDSYTIEHFDQRNLINWLNQSAAGKDRNLMIAGNDWGRELMQVGQETLNFYTTWLASDYLENAVGVITVDSVPGLLDHTGGHDFMTEGDAQCILAGGCPTLEYFDVVDARPGVVGNEVVADYQLQDTSTKPAGVAYAHPTLGYKTINLGFGVEFMMDGTTFGGSGNYTPEGYFHTGVADRVDLMDNVMSFFDMTPTIPGTGIEEGTFVNALSQAYPNPFNPVTEIAYSVREAGPVAIEVYNVAGRVVRTLLREELEAGASGHVAWDGRDEAGDRCASGVYFYRIAAPGFTASRKMIMLK